MRLILLITIGVSVAFGGDIFVDKDTDLMWQDNYDAQTITKTWRGAKNYCSSLTLGGYSDWRLPSIKELQSIVDIKKYKPAIKDGFENVASYYYWSSSEGVTNSSYAWYVYFSSGAPNKGAKSLEYYVRCVRGRQ